MGEKLEEERAKQDKEVQKNQKLFLKEKQKLREEEGRIAVQVKGRGKDTHQGTSGPVRTARS